MNLTPRERAQKFWGLTPPMIRPKHVTVSKEVEEEKIVYNTRERLLKAGFNLNWTSVGSMIQVICYATNKDGFIPDTQAIAIANTEEECIEKLLQKLKDNGSL